MKYELTLVLGVSLALLKANAVKITFSGDMTNDNVFLARSDFSHPPMNIFQILIVVLHPFRQR